MLWGWLLLYFYVWVNWINNIFKTTVHLFYKVGNAYQHFPNLHLLHVLGTERSTLHSLISNFKFLEEGLGCISLWSRMISESSQCLITPCLYYVFLVLPNTCWCVCFLLLLCLRWFEISIKYFFLFFCLLILHLRGILLCLFLI